MAHRWRRGVPGPPAAEGRGSSAASGPADSEEAENRGVAVALGNVEYVGGLTSSFCAEEMKVVGVFKRKRKDGDLEAGRADSPLEAFWWRNGRAAGVGSRGVFVRGRR